jgi:hypothetical protein
MALRHFGQYQGAGVFTGFGLRLRHFAQRYRLPLTAVFGRVFLPVFGILFDIGTPSALICCGRDVHSSESSNVHTPIIAVLRRCEGCRRSTPRDDGSAGGDLQHQAAQVGILLLVTVLSCPLRDLRFVESQFQRGIPIAIAYRRTVSVPFGTGHRLCSVSKSWFA